MANNAKNTTSKKNTQNTTAIKKWGIPEEGAIQATITNMSKSGRFFKVTAECDNTVWQWNIIEDISFDALVAPAMEYGWSGNVGDDGSLCEFYKGTCVNIYHKDKGENFEPKKYRHAYYINEVVAK